MRVRVLGAIEVLDPPGVALGGPTQRRVLTALLLNAGRVVSVDQLVDAVWPEGNVPERAEHNVRTYVHRLRAALDGAGERIETNGTGYRLRIDRDELDAARFEDLVVEARTAAARQPERTQELLDDALALWGGRPYDEFADEAWTQAEVTRLREVRASALEHRFVALLDLGRHTEVVGSLREAVTEEPWREARRMQLALALYRSGRQAEALRSIQHYKSALADELGLEPSPELDQLEHRILEHDPSLLPATHQQHTLRGYQLDEVIEEGAFSLVWRGMQPSLGRKVAVKQIRAELANQPDFVRRFETEAQTVASLEHPHILPLYDYWREPDSAYLVMRYVPGGSLETEVLTHRLDDGRLRRMIEQVGSALHTAHRSGVIHRDVKSANVLIDAEDNFYLTDFGIAFTGSVADDELANALSTGSPAYASPEQLRRQELDHRTDIYGFGITLFEAATGRLPFIDAPTQAAIVARQLEDPVPSPSSVGPSVPRWVDEIVARATAKSPGDRYASMAELMAAVPAIATSTGGRPTTATLLGELVNPFKALGAFREADAADFHGRDRLVARFVEVLERPGSGGRMLAVVGPSGSGKSSAVRSGLLPRLRQGAVAGSQDWFITTMLPGSHPFDELESALTRVAVRHPGPLVELMRDDPRGVSRAVNQILPDEESELLLVIDQFEELFTHAADSDRTKFLNGLLAAVREPRARLRVAMTIRADHWDRPLRHPGLAARLETAAVTVSPLAADELEAAIVEPVRRQGAAYEPGVVARIIADVGDQAGALPLLQYALTELFDANASGLIRSESYDAIGGLAGAIASRAEAEYDALTEAQQLAARRLFGRLVTLGEGIEDTRRRVRTSELGDGPDTAAVITAFGEARMLVFDRDPATREPTVEVAHEALLRAWPRLRRWLDEDRDGLRIHRHLTETTAAWLTSGRDRGELYRGGRLETAAAWSVDHASDLNTDEREFLDTSVAAHEVELAAEREHLEHQVRSNRRLRMLVAIASVVAVVAALAGVFALRERSRADQEAQEARNQAEEAESQRQNAGQFASLAAERALQAELAAEEAEAARTEAEAARTEAERVALEAESSAAEADLQRVRSDALRLAEDAATSVSPDAALALLVAVEAHRLDPSLEGNNVLHRALTAGPSSFDAVFAGQESVLEQSLSLPQEQDLMLEDPAARLYTAVVDGGDGILTSVEAPDGRTSTVVRHERAGSSWVMDDTGLEAVVTNAGDFTIWVSDEIIVRGPDGLPLGSPIPRPADDLLSFTLSQNGELVVLQRPNGVLDVYESSGDLIGTVTVPDAPAGATYVVSVLADGSMIAAFTLLSAPVRPIGPWAIWNTEPLSLMANGISGFEFGAAEANRSLEFPLLHGSQLYAADRLWAVDPATFQRVDDRQYALDDRLLSAEGLVVGLTDSNEFGLLAGPTLSFDTEGVAGELRIWDTASSSPLGRGIALETEVPIADLRLDRARFDAQFDAAGRLIVQKRDSVSIWNYDVSTWPELACSAARRNMTRPEWEEYGPRGVEYRKTCDQYPITG